MSEIVFPSTKAGNEVDRAVTAALSTIPGQITQIDTRVTALEEDVDDLSGLPAQVTQIGLKLDEVKRVTDSVGAVYLGYTYTITEGAISGGNRTFNISDLNASIGDILLFKVTSNNGEISRYRILSNTGKVPYGSNGDYYLPNITYTISISVSTFLSSSTFGFYINADDALAGGTVHAEMLVLRQGNVSLSSILTELDSNVERLDGNISKAQQDIATLTEKTNSIPKNIGYYSATGTYTVSAGVACGNNRLVNMSDVALSLGDVIIFRVTCDDGVISRFRIISNTGKLPTLEPFYFQNEVFAIRVEQQEFIEADAFGFYVRAEDALMNGTMVAEMIILKKGVTLADYVLSLDDKIKDSALHTGVISRSMFYEVSPSIASGSNNTFKTADFNLSLNDTITFKVTCDDGIINRFCILSSIGKHPTSTSAFYQPNTSYTIEVVNQDFIASPRFGFYVNAQDALAVGSMRAEMVIVKRNSTDTPLPLAVRIATLEEDVAELEEQVGERDLPLSGKTVWTVGDSLFSNTWQSHFVDVSGATFYPGLNLLNSKPISWGGSNSSPEVDSGSQARAINLVSYKNDYDMDIILFENINDRNLLSRGGSIDDVPFMRSQKISYPISETLPTYTDVQSYVNENLSSIVSSIESNKRKRGTIISIPYTSGSQVRGSRITFLTTPTSEGDITINLNGAKSVHVTTGMTIQDIVDAFIQYSYGSGWTDVDNGDGSISIYYYTTTSTRATFDGGNTGVTARVEDTTGTGEYNLFFVGDSVSEWGDTTKWVTTLSLYSIYKGLIEYLKTELPESQLYFVFPFSVGVDFSATTYKHGDGTWSQDKFVESTTYATQKSLYDIQKECADFYGVPCLDLVANAGMNIINIETYFYTNNVHPKVIGYNRYADTILKLLK